MNESIEPYEFFLVDKSALQMMSKSEFELLCRLGIPVIVDILLAEVFGTLAKTSNSSKDQPGVSDLAGKFLANSRCTFCPFYKTLVHDSLLGFPVNMQRRPLSRHEIDPDSHTARSVDQIEQVLPLLNYYRTGEFDDEQKALARQWRSQKDSHTLSRLTRPFQKRSIPLPAYASPNDAAQYAESLLRNPNLSIPLMNCLLEIIGPDRHSVLTVSQLAMGRNGFALSSHAKYATYCLKVLMIVAMCWKANSIRTKSGGTLNDTSYLMYLPFAKVFVSNDKLHQRIVPVLLEDQQQFLDGDTVKSELKLLQDVDFDELDAVPNPRHAVFSLQILGALRPDLVSQEVQ